MSLSTNLYKSLPLYAQLADEQKILQTMLDRGIQVELDDLYEIIRNRHLYFSPTAALSDAYLDWLGQFFGLNRTSTGGWIGIGLNPNWSADYKREVIVAAPEYFQQKGTKAGIIQALKLWLEWSEPVVEFSYPIDNLWFSYGDILAPEIAKGIFERKRLGSGDYFPGSEFGDYWQLYSKELIDPQTPELGVAKGDPQDTRAVSQSRLAENNVWLQLYPENDTIWNAIAQRLPRLIIESFDINAIVTPVVWWKIPSPDQSIPEIAQTISVVCQNHIYTVPGAVVITEDETRVEYAFRPKSEDEILQIELRGSIYLEPEVSRQINPNIIVAISIVGVPYVKPIGMSAIHVTSEGDLLGAVAKNDLYVETERLESCLTIWERERILPVGLRSIFITSEGDLIGAVAKNDLYVQTEGLESCLTIWDREIVLPMGAKSIFITSEGDLIGAVSSDDLYVPTDDMNSSLAVWDRDRVLPMGAKSIFITSEGDLIGTVSSDDLFVPTENMNSSFAIWLERNKLSRIILTESGEYIALESGEYIALES